jgi:hypothetical protein
VRASGRPINGRKQKKPVGASRRRARSLRTQGEMDERGHHAIQERG